jgi:formylmethanofuran dehydrogenase subunit A
MLRIAQGRVYDPANGIDGEVRDVCLDDGKVVGELPAHAPRIDARGMVVMPGGVDIHSHIAGPAVNAARKLAPEEHRADVLDRTATMRSGTGGTVPSSFATGYRYALLGYTTVVDAATPPLAARHTLAELRDTPIVDAAFLVLMGNNLPLFELIRDVRADGAGRVTEAIAWWLEATGGYGVKLVNPGGVEMWKRGNRNVTSLDDEVEGLGVTPRRVLATIATAVDELGLPHPVHVHCNNLGVAGNWRTTLDTLDTLQGRRAHLAHLQFHAYGGTPGKRPRSRAPELAEHLDAHPEHSADIGQVMFGPATTMTADAPVSAVLREITGGKWVNADLEAETGCGIVPFAYRERNYVHALQWGIGLELFLLSRDPWRVVLSTDHPNGGSFLSYPRLIRLLMDREFRNEQIARVNQKAIGRTVLRDDLEREYTLGEIAIVTRAGPARLLGLADKGHLGVGADADVTVYSESADREQMFATPRYVIKSGQMIVEEGELRDAPAGDLLRVAADYDEEIERALEPLFEERYSVQFSNYPVREPWLLEPARRIHARRGRSEP